MQKLNKIFVGVALAFFSLNIIAFTGVNYVFAEDTPIATQQYTDIDSVLVDKPDSVPGFRTTSGNAESQVNYVIFKIVDIILIVAGSLAVFFITLSGVRFVVATGSQDMIDAAKRNLQYAVLGLLAVILSWAIINNVVKILFTKDESASTECRELGCACFSDSACDSGKCSRSGSEHAIGTSDGKSLIKVCQPKK